MVLPGGVGVKHCAGPAIRSAAAIKSPIKFRRQGKPRNQQLREPWPCSSLLVRTALAVLAVTSAVAARAETPADFLRSFETAARQAQAGFAGFSAARGAAFFNSTHGREWRCASCHTRNPATTGRHAKTDKPITPLAPAANAERFAQVEKWSPVRSSRDIPDLSRTSTKQIVPGLHWLCTRVANGFVACRN